MAQLPAAGETIAELLDSTDLAKDFVWQELLLISKYMVLLSATPGVVIVAEHAQESFLCVLARGSALVYKEDSKGAQRRLATMRPGRVFGEMALIDGWPRSASVVAESDSRIAVLTKGQMEKLNQDLPELGLKFVWRIAETVVARLRRTSGALVDYMGSDKPEKS